MNEDEEIPFSWQEGDGGLPGQLGPTIRENVDAGTDVIDLSAMREQLEAQRRGLRGGG